MHMIHSMIHAYDTCIHHSPEPCPGGPATGHSPHPPPLPPAPSRRHHPGSPSCGCPHPARRSLLHPPSPTWPHLSRWLHHPPRLRGSAPGSLLRRHATRTLHLPGPHGHLAPRRPRPCPRAHRVHALQRVQAQVGQRLLALGAAAGAGSRMPGQGGNRRGNARARTPGERAIKGRKRRVLPCARARSRVCVGASRGQASITRGARGSVSACACVRASMHAQ